MSKRFDATQRTYRYKISTFKDVFNFDNAYYYTNKLDVDLMNKASTILLEWAIDAAKRRGVVI